MYHNIYNCILILLKKIGNNIIISFVVFFGIIIFLIIIIFVIFIRNINKDTKQLIHIRKVFKVCKSNE